SASSEEPKIASPIESEHEKSSETSGADIELDSSFEHQTVSQPRWFDVQEKTIQKVEEKQLPHGFVEGNEELEDSYMPPHEPDEEQIIQQSFSQPRWFDLPETPIPEANNKQTPFAKSAEATQEVELTQEELEHIERIKRLAEESELPSSSVSNLQPFEDSYMPPHEPDVEQTEQPFSQPRWFDVPEIASPDESKDEK
uniref:Uncharacterized protein n=1 Tax=Acrobeloides nanus TaxID=290746 RepID=A0A914DNS8_9BILA